jgi:hypothetical protein
VAGLAVFISGVKGLKYSNFGTGGPMFDSLTDQMRRDEHLEVSNNERLVRWCIVAVVSVVIFGGLYVGIQLLQ